MTKWVILIIRGDGSIDLLPASVCDDIAEATEQAKRRCGWYQCVDVAIAPLTIDLAAKIPVTLEG